LVKEADTLTNAGYDVTVLYSYWNEWGTACDNQLLEKKAWKAIRVGGDPDQKPVVYFFSRLIYRVAVTVTKRIKIGYLVDLAVARGSFFLIREARRHKAAIYIGHNLGALPAALKAARANKKPCGFDAEDFHRFEVSDDAANPDVILKTYIENKYIPQVDYLSASSSLIAAAYHKLYPFKYPVTLLNVFPIEPAVNIPTINQNGPIKLFWFSQTIGANRGIEDIVNALKLLKATDFELHLLGYIANESKQTFIDDVLSGGANIYLHEPVSPGELISFASQFDIGLASENNIPLNRDICLTNKLFTYLQSGLAIVASNTTAQQAFIAENPEIGKLYDRRNPQSLADILLAYQANRETLLNTRKASLKLGRQKLNWENESIKFLSLVNATLNKFE